MVFLRSGSRDIRNVIPFSGRGIVLGGSTQPSASTQKPPMQSPSRSPEPLQEPARASTDQVSLADPRMPNGVTNALPKRSVANHRAFVNINGSPVRITKTNGSLVRPKQRTVQDLFRNRNLKSPKETNPTEPKQASNTQVNLNSAQTSPVNKSSPSTSGSAGSPFSKYFRSNKSTGIPAQVKAGIPGTRISGSGLASQIKPENTAPGSNLKYFGSPKSSGTGMPASSSTGVPGFESHKRSGTSSADFGSRVLSSDLTHFGSPKDPGTRIPSSSSTSAINSESGIPNSNAKHVKSQKSSGTGTSGSSNIPSSDLKLSGSPEKSGSFVPASASRSPHKSGAAAGGRKRWREDRNSAHIFDFFQQVSHSPATSSSSVFSREQREEGSGAKVPSAGASGVGSAPVSCSALTVTCPVCQSKVLETQINQHLDSCLMCH